MGTFWGYALNGQIHSCWIFWQHLVVKMDKGWLGAYCSALGGLCGDRAKRHDLRVEHGRNHRNGERAGTAVNTPETDSKATDIIGFFSCSTVPANFARNLERERDEARDQRDAITLRLGQTQEHLVDARRSAEQWRAVAAKYAGCTENECNRLPWETPWDSQRNS